MEPKLHDYKPSNEFVNVMVRITGTVDGWLGYKLYKGLS